jgi:hypothetical protein
MVFRPEGAADLRRHLHGNRIPADIYLRRKMQSVDPDLGPVVPVGPLPESPPPPAAAPEPAARADEGPPAPELPLRPATPPAAVLPEAQPLLLAPSPTPTPRRSGVRSLAEFDPPLPPPARTAGEVQAVLSWMLEHDALIPNNLPRLEAIHATASLTGGGSRLGYTQHILLQVEDDLALHETQEALHAHLERLAAAYRRAALSYGRAADGRQEGVNGVLWRMASLASRLRLESWVYQSRHGAPPQLATSARRPPRTGRTR